MYMGYMPQVDCMMTPRRNGHLPRTDEIFLGERSFRSVELSVEKAEKWLNSSMATGIDTISTRGLSETLCTQNVLTDYETVSRSLTNLLWRNSLETLYAMNGLKTEFRITMKFYKSLYKFQYFFCPVRFILSRSRGVFSLNFTLSVVRQFS